MNELWLVLAALTGYCHLLFPIFVLFGGLLGGWKRWIIPFHLFCFVYAILIQVIDFPCFLTNIEKWLIIQGGETPYSGYFVDHYIFEPANLVGRETLVATFFFIAVIFINATPYRNWLRAKKEI